MTWPHPVAVHFGAFGDWVPTCYFLSMLRMAKFHSARVKEGFNGVLLYTFGNGFDHLSAGGLFELKVIDSLSSSTITISNLFCYS